MTLCGTIVVTVLACGVPIAAMAAPASGLAGTSVPCPASALGDSTVTEVTPAGTLLTADGREVVLAGVAFPQAVGAPHDSAGLSARIARLAVGPVRIAPDGEADRYGRIRANVFAPDGGWLQAILVREGLALARPGGGEARCVRALLDLEEGARRAGVCLWAGSRVVGEAADRTSLLARNGLYAVVEGRVVSVGYGSRMVLLDFGRNYSTDFTVMVPNPLVPRLLEAEIAVETLVGQAVRVRGIIEESGGPAIRLGDPSELEVLNREE